MLKLENFALYISFLALCWVAPGATTTQAQSLDDLYIYGYFQVQHRYGTESLGGIRTTTNTFSLQQLNLLFRKNINESLSGFVDIEALNSFSTTDGWGSFGFSEAWVRYFNKRALILKIGLQVPTFNNLNDIKNRTPLLPYILRPAVYESSFDGLIPLSAFIPSHAYASISGTLTPGTIKFDYSFYTGNEREFSAKESKFQTSLPAGSDTTHSKLWGGRIGIRKNGLKIGASGTRDRGNPNNLGASPTGLGPIQRYRLGLDFSWNIGTIFIETESIWVFHHLSAVQQELIWEQARSNPVFTDNLDKSFYYTTVGYRIDDTLTLYTTYNLLKDNSNIFFAKGFRAFMLGGAYKPADNLAIKLQVIQANLKKNEGISLEFKGFYLFSGMSLLF